MSLCFFCFFLYLPSLRNVEGVSKQFVRQRAAAKVERAGEQQHVSCFRCAVLSYSARIRTNNEWKHSRSSPISYPRDLCQQTTHGTCTFFVFVWFHYSISQPPPPRRLHHHNSTPFEDSRLHIHICNYYDTALCSKNYYYYYCSQ